MVRFIPFASVTAIVGGLAALIWYEQLPAGEQKAADKLASDYARDLFGKQLAQLTPAEAQRVECLARQHSAN